MLNWSIKYECDFSKSHLYVNTNNLNQTPLVSILIGTCFPTAMTTVGIKVFIWYSLYKHYRSKDVKYPHNFSNEMAYLSDTYCHFRANFFNSCRFTISSLCSDYLTRFQSTTNLCLGISISLHIAITWLFHTDLKTPT